MPHVHLGNDLPGIRGLLLFRPETAQPLSELSEILLRGPSTLSRGERELIAARVSTLNECQFCALSHGAFAAAQLPDGTEVVGQVCADPAHAEVSAKLRSLLEIAGKVQQSGKAVTAAVVDAARAAGASDMEIHDTVLIAASFCMYNRYVDGLATIAPGDPAAYQEMAKLIVADGYMPPL